MKSHKAPTQVTIAGTREETLVSRVVSDYWRPAAILGGGVALAILLVQILTQRAEAKADASWERLRKDVGFGLRLQTPGAAVLGGLAEELASTPSGPWAKALQVGEFVQKGEYDASCRAAEELAAKWADHPVAKDPLYEGKGVPQTLVQRLQSRKSALEAWEGERPYLLANPSLPEGSPRVRVETSRGAFVLGLYEGDAPRHVENFLKLCGEGFYNGTKVHKVIPRLLVQGGDPNSREGAPETWGSGGPGYDLEPEAGKLSHFKLVIASIQEEDKTASNGSQFMITVADAHAFDGKSTVFGVVLEGAEVLEQIASAELAEDRPLEPVVVESTTIL